MGFRTTLAASLVLTMSVGVAAGQAETAQPDNAALLQRLDEQEQHIKELERRLKAQEDAHNTAAAAAQATAQEAKNSAAGITRSAAEHPTATSATPAAPGAAGGEQTNAIVTAGPRGFQISTPDGKNVLRLRANFAVDGRLYDTTSIASSANTCRHGFSLCNSCPRYYGEAHANRGKRRASARSGTARRSLPGTRSTADSSRSPSPPPPSVRRT